jgi:hypothetical protein
VSEWHYSRDGIAAQVKRRLIIDAASFLCLLDQLEQTGKFGFRPALNQVFKILLREPGPEVVNHVKILPPAVTDLEAGQGRIARIHTIAEFHGPSQSGAAPFHVMDRVIYHL